MSVINNLTSVTQLNITLLCLHYHVNKNNTAFLHGYNNNNISVLCPKDYSDEKRDKIITLSRSNSNNNNKMKTFHMQPKLDRTTHFYGSYDPKIGIRTGLVLTAFLFLLIAYTLYKTKCKRSRWSRDDKKFIDRYSKVLTDKWSGKSTRIINRQGTITSSKAAKPSIDETAKWIQSQPLQEVSVLPKWTLQNKMYNICLESLKATACPVCSVGDLGANVNESNSLLPSAAPPPSLNKMATLGVTPFAQTSLSDTNIMNLGNPHVHNAQNNIINTNTILPLATQQLQKEDNYNITLPKVSNELDQKLSVIDTLKSLDTNLLFDNKNRQLENSNSVKQMYKLQKDVNDCGQVLNSISDNRSFVVDPSLEPLYQSGSEPSGDVLSPVTLETCSHNSSEYNIAHSPNQHNHKVVGDKNTSSLKQKIAEDISLGQKNLMAAVPDKCSTNYATSADDKSQNRPDCSNENPIEMTNFDSPLSEAFKKKKKGQECRNFDDSNNQLQQNFWKHPNRGSSNNDDVVVITMPDLPSH